MNPKTCIIVLSHNGLDVTKKFLNDLYANTQNFVLIMIDNGSSDGTPIYLSEFSTKHDNVIFVANDENLGVIGGRNQGYEMYKNLPDAPDYFMFLDNDQYVQSGWLEHHHEVLEAGDFDIVGVEAWLIDHRCVPVMQCKKPSDAFSYVGCGGMLIKREVTDKIGMFDSGFNPCYFEDPDFCYRAREAGFKIGWNYKPRLIHLAHQTLGVNPRKREYFLKSHAYFKSKWHKKSMKPILQARLPVLA
jgi:GT2 family glycosyltransferase